MATLTKTEQLQATLKAMESPNVVTIGATGFEAEYDKVIVMADEFRSGYECARCKGANLRTTGQGYTQKQISMIVCPGCEGSGRRGKVGRPEILVTCTECDGKREIPCPDCKGTGTSNVGGIATPEQAEGAPTTGTIVSIGPSVPEGKRKLGDRVMVPSYAGHEFVVKAKTPEGTLRKVSLRFLRDEEILCKIYGQLEYRDVTGARALHTNA